MLSSMEKEKKGRDTFELLTNSHEGFFSFFFLFPTVSLREGTHMVSHLYETSFAVSGFISIV